MYICIIVAHPDDETLWAGGIILMHPRWRCFIFSLCRIFDPDRAPKFKKALTCLGASESMADMDDGSRQHPLSRNEVLHTVLQGIDPSLYDKATGRHSCRTGLANLVCCHVFVCSGMY